VLARKRSRRARGVFGIALLAALAAGGGFFTADELAWKRRHELDVPESRVVAHTARDEALLGLAFLSQTNQRERFMDRMVAAAGRYEAEGKAADAKLLRDVASVALSSGERDALKFLNDVGDKPSEADVANRKAKDAIARLKIDERRVAYSIYSLDADDAVARNKLAQALLDVAKGYEDVRDHEDAKAVQDAADALVRGEREAALKLLGLPHADGGPVTKESRLEVRELLDSAKRELAGVRAGTTHPGYRVSAAKSLFAASVIAKKLGAAEASAALARASDACNEKEPDDARTGKLLDEADALVEKQLASAAKPEVEKK
jgi:hypothetical protein